MADTIFVSTREAAVSGLFRLLVRFQSSIGRPARVPPGQVIDDIVAAYLAELAPAQAGFLGASPSAELVAAAQSSLRETFVAALLEPDARFVASKRLLRKLLSAERPKVGEPVWSRWRDLLPLEVVSGALCDDLRHVFLPASTAVARRLRYQQTAGLVAAALQESILSTPVKLHKLNAAVPVSTSVQGTLAEALNKLESVRQRFNLPVVRPLGSALLELQSEVAEAEGFVSIPLRSPVTSPLQSMADLEMYSRLPARSIDLARQVVRSAGVVLVAGYRGVGKSSLVNDAVLHHVPELTARQSGAAHYVVVPVQVNLAKASGIDSVLRLCIRAAYRALFRDTTRSSWLRRDELEHLGWSYLRASYKVESKDSASIETAKHVEASMEVKLASLVPAALSQGPLGLIVGAIPKIGPAISAKWSRDSKKKLERTIALLDYDEDRAEEDLQTLIDLLARERTTCDGRVRIKLALVFDEMDKMEEKQQEELLKRCKNLFLSRDAVFILVTSKRFYYDWLKQRNVEDSMLGSYFSSVVVVPLFTSADTQRLIEKMQLLPASSVVDTNDTSEVRNTLISDLALCLTYRAGGLPREIVRRLDEVQEWLSDGLQPIISSRSSCMPSVQVYAAIQRVLETLPKTVGGAANVTPDTQRGTATEFLWIDEVRTEQVMRGLYVLMEELLTTRSLDLLKVSDFVRPKADVPVGGLAKLAQLYLDNFTLVPPTEFVALMETLATRLLTLKAPDGETSFFERREPPADDPRNVTSVLWVNDVLYALTGRSPGAASESSAPLASTTDPLAQLGKLLEDDGLPVGQRLIDLRAVGLLKEITGTSSQNQEEELLRLLSRYTRGRGRSTDSDDRASWEQVVAAMLEALERVHSGDIVGKVVECFDPRQPFAEPWLEPLIGLSGAAPDGALELVALLAEANFEQALPMVLAPAFARERHAQRLFRLWRRLLPRRAEPAARSVLVELLSRLPETAEQPDDVVQWLASDDWSEVDDRLLALAARREKRLGPYLAGFATDASAGARDRLAKAGLLVEPSTRAERKSEATRKAADSQATESPPQAAASVVAAKRPLGRVQRFFVWAWPVAVALLYLSVPIELPSGADLGTVFGTRVLQALLYGFLGLGLVTLSVLLVGFNWTFAGVTAAFLGAAAAFGAGLVLAMHAPFDLGGQLVLFGLLVAAAGGPLLVTSVDRLRGPRPRQLLVASSSTHDPPQAGADELKMAS